ncbi:hypothetical protein MKK88_17040 [Methylobacterium sp. E-005]|uniref:hypothetical protein n=1 Tax=Methylobacterium sp. E-005 TaxID=2836549 RepID=UPI001FBA9A57|nr:hypothetical protein [Methylobacterium sp. E-005]MCJ2087675.1 hypothetical protein [Methylobacterium sp. E-005]
MRAEPPILTAPAWGCLILLSLLLGASLAIRLQAYAGPSEAGGMPAREVALPPIDLGAGVMLPRALAGRYRAPLGTCSSPALVTFVDAGPYGSDPSLMDAPHPGDRITYIWRGWNLGRRFATVGLNVIYFTQRAWARLTTGRNPTSDDVAVKIVVPAGCDVSPDVVLAAFRKQMAPAG